ncbi:MAG: TIGR02710 family CRISPR-associated CARF protein [Armatimonadota bacterium]|nr:TIGR02710 family CRISPR-associated CARF protein [Armatimonadota bacterium]
MVSMATALILTVGTTADPLVKAVEEHLRQDPDLVVFLLYGRPFPGQDPSPFDVAQQVRSRAAQLGVRAEPREVTDPENLDVCLEAAREVLREAAGNDQVIVNFTGGTKPLSAAVVHAALTEPIAGSLVMEYTGGERRDSAGRVVSGAMRVRPNERTATEETTRQVLELLRRFAYREARYLASRLPEAGRAGFIKRCVDALYKWDEFDYEASRELLWRHYEVARALGDVGKLAPLAHLVQRLVEPADRLVGASRQLRQLQDGRATDWPQPEDVALLTADTLENAARRLTEERFTDTVLRAYRAVETAVQARLLAHRVNPWRPEWDRLDPGLRSRYQLALEGRNLPRELALTTGLRLVEILEGPLPETLTELLRDIQFNRNRSYLEHGYHRVQAGDARRLLDHAAEVCAHLLQADLVGLRERVTHSV